MRNKDVSDKIHAFTAQVNLDPSTDLMAFLESLSIDDQRKAFNFSCENSCKIIRDNLAFRLLDL